MFENRMLIDSEWGELEYGVPDPSINTAYDEDDDCRQYEQEEE